MNVFELHRNVIADYEKYIRSFIRIADPEIQKVVDAELSRGKLWPEPLLQFNPAFKSAGKVSDLATDGTVHSQVADVFKGYSLYQHQLDAIRLGAAGKDFVVTSGTGSGKSLTYIGTVFSHLLRNASSKGVVAIVVYPLNALINSPNHWAGSGGVGAKHWFFILDGCRNPDGARGLYNEFLRSELEPQRRVFELLGSKMRCQPQEDQMSGVGFTAGRGDRVGVTVGGADGSNRTYEINF